jgi:signal transduction histidine kinase
MKERKSNLFRRITVLVLSIIAVLGLVFTTITYLANKHYQQAGMQLQNREVAGLIARFSSPYTGRNAISQQKADSVFHQAMVLCPNAEVYFLDTAGGVLAYRRDEKKVQQWKVPLGHIQQFIHSKGESYIKGEDPRDAGKPKIFSAAVVPAPGGALGYVYVILAGHKSQSVMAGLFKSQVTYFALIAIFTVILLSSLFSFFYLRRMQSNFQQMVGVLEQFEKGDYTARFPSRSNDEYALITQSFNKMADLLFNNIQQLTRSGQERKTFIATISHDLRTPLSIARGYTETLLLRPESGGITPDEQHHYAQLIYSKMLQIENMVKQLFEISKMDAIEFKPAKEPFIFSEIVQETVNASQGMAIYKNIDLKCMQCQNPDWVNADISMMERVIQNLLDNAIKNTPEGGSIQASLSADNKEMVFKIESTGTPITNDLLQWINDCMEDGNIYARRPVRSGLGLIIVKKILYLHRFPLHAYSGNNTNTFSFRMPVHSPILS